MVYGFAQQSGGDVRISSRPEQGTRVSIWLPRVAPPAPQAEPATGLNLVPARGTGHVLVVDDQPAILRILSAVLSRAGFTPATAANGEEALEQLRNGAPCGLLLTDLSMPGMSGTELINEALLLRPDLPCILMSGFDVTDTLDQRPTHVTLLRKPFSADTLLKEARSLLESVS
jgi:DNA-binding NtrC family response regulator